MKFIKENLFLMALVSVTIVLVAVVIVVERSYAAAADKGAGERTSLSGQLGSLAKGNYANQAVVDAEAEKVRLARVAVERAKEGLIERNRRQYRVMTFVADDKTYVAFPIDKDLYAKVGAEYRIAQAYQDEVEDLLKRLSPTEAPTAAEIDEAVRPVETTGRIVGPAPVSAAPASARPFAAGSASGRPFAAGSASGRPVARSSGTPEENAEPRPEDIARDKLIRDRALKGKIYANKDESMHMVLLSEQVRYSLEELWFAQVSLWVMGDIVEAVKVTNEQASSAGLGVPVSAVKRLVESEVLGYVVGQSGAAGGRNTSGAATTGGRGTSGAAANAASAPVDLQYFTGGARGTGSRAPNLTGRGCSQLYDVVHYRFVVVMPIKNLPHLCRNMMEQNYHTIIDVHISTTDSDVQARSGAADTMARRGRLGGRSYYYGTDSVVQVSITGELLLLTDWTRGRKKQTDPKTGEEVKGYPELMPGEFLASLGALDAGALRPEDVERAGPITAAPTIARPSAVGRPRVVRRIPGGMGGAGRGADALGEP